MNEEPKQEYYLLVDEDGTNVFTLDEIMENPSDYDGETFLRVEKVSKWTLGIIPEQIKFEQIKPVEKKPEAKKTKRKGRKSKYRTIADRKEAARKYSRDWQARKRAAKLQAQPTLLESGNEPVSITRNTSN